MLSWARVGAAHSVVFGGFSSQALYDRITDADASLVITADGTITLTVRGAPDRVELTVADTGEGIPESDLPHVFDRFYRGEPARTRDSHPVAAPGAGLGLAIAKGIVEAHGGSISASGIMSL
jgi:signal transduction histidine kinase